jgi:hypothetical protein
MDSSAPPTLISPNKALCEWSCGLEQVSLGLKKEDKGDLYEEKI